MNWLLVVVLIAVVIVTIVGYHRGFVKMMVGLLALVLAIIGSSVLAPVVSETIENQTQLRETIARQIEKYFEKAIEEKLGEVSKQKQTELIGKLPLPDSVKGKLKSNNTLENYAKLGVSDFSDYVSHYIAKTVLRAISYTVIFLILYIGLRILFTALNLVSLLPFIKGVNKLAGGVLGFVHALVYVWLFFAIATAFMNTDWGMEVMKLTAESKVLSLIYNYNFILMFILRVI